LPVVSRPLWRPPKLSTSVSIRHRTGDCDPRLPSDPSDLGELAKTRQWIVRRPDTTARFTLQAFSFRSMKNPLIWRPVKPPAARPQSRSEPGLSNERKRLVMTQASGWRESEEGSRLIDGCQTTGDALSKSSRACQEPTLAAGFRRRALFRGTLAPIKSAGVPLAASDRRSKGCNTLSSSPYVSGRKRRQRDLPSGLADSRDQL
jgi:hypothetical protein